MRAMRRSLMLATLLLSAVNAAPAAAGAQCAPLAQMTSLDIRASAAVPIVTALVGHKPVGLLVDTGGAFSGLTKRAVQELDLQTGQYLTR